ncbi:MAG: putative methyltransferase [Sphingomonas bacterium]|uniref:FkbM family methyltransferase n=1 Tax=Sphingomonas bacterium TaxID=1895847 RepID=UPI002637720B|nr:FkbM family methyltransferase [Sphingomonas bacterium]MDB5706261.1 putative methyltransferase [Sphingomonas bacterium]
MVAEQIRKLMSWHAATRAPLSGPLYTFCRRYVMAWSNAEVDIDVNGERWLVQAIARHTPAPGSVYVDVGANVGDWSRLVVDNAPGARLIAFEPVPPVRDQLIGNLAGRNAEILPYALSDQAGKVEINYTPGNSHFSSIETVGKDTQMEGQVVEVQRRTGDDICAELGIGHIRFLKVDTEGHDLKVIEGFRNAIDASRIDVIQFEYNYMSIFSRTFLRDFFAALTPGMRIGRLLRDRIEYFDYAPALDNFIQANFIAVRADLSEGELAFLSRR